MYIKVDSSQGRAKDKDEKERGGVAVVPVPVTTTTMAAERPVPPGTTTEIKINWRFFYALAVTLRSAPNSPTKMSNILMRLDAENTQTF